MNRIETAGSSSTNRIIAFRLMILTLLLTSAIADVKYMLCPLMQLSPKKSPEPKMPRTARLPRFETDVSFTTPSSM
jgi:hypothetical protein